MNSINQGLSFFPVRCYAIVYPMKAKSVCTVSKANKVVGIVWLLAFLLATPTLQVQVTIFFKYILSGGEPRRKRKIR